MTVLTAKETIISDCSLQNWEKVCRSALAKMLSELIYEEFFVVEETSTNLYRLTLASKEIYEFEAQIGAWDNFLIDPDSINHITTNNNFPCPLQFIINTSQARKN